MNKKACRVVLLIEPVAFMTAVAVAVVVGSLSNDHVNGNENGKNAKVLDWQNNNSARASCFFVHSFAVTARQRRENASFHVLWTT